MQIAASAPLATTGYVTDVTMTNFMAEVIDSSHKQPVIVDFWAPWCGPCKQLGPMLEKLVLAAKGAVRLAKIDIDASPQIAQQMRIQSVPAVFAFFRGQPIDGFMGAQPEAQLKQWIDKIIKATGGAAGGEDEAWIQEALAQAEDALTTGDTATAHAIFADVWDRNPDNAAAYAGILRCLIADKKSEDARRMIEQASPEMAKAKELDAVHAALDLLHQAESASSLTELEAKLAKNPDDHQSRFDLALACYAIGEREKAVDALLEIIKRQRSWNDDAARAQLLKLFEAFGQTDPLTIASRKRLSSILFS